MPTDFDILLHTLFTWSQNFKCWSMVSPKNLVAETWLIKLFPNFIGRTVNSFRWVNKMNTVFEWLTVNLFLVSHWLSGIKFCSTVRAMNPLSWFSKAQVTVLSSANSVNFKKLLQFGRSLINKRNKRGPKIDPCGTPWVILDFLEFTLFTDMFWSRLDK